MASHDVNFATKSNKFKSKSLDECLNNLYTLRTNLKGQHNKNKRQGTEPAKLVPISFVELKIKREKNEYVFLKELFDLGASAMLVSQTAARHLNKTVTKSTVFSMTGEMFQSMEKSG